MTDFIQISNFKINLKNFDIILVEDQKIIFRKVLFDGKYFNLVVTYLDAIIEHFNVIYENLDYIKIPEVEFKSLKEILSSS